MDAEDIMIVLELTRAVTAASLLTNVPPETNLPVQAEAQVFTIHRMELLLPPSPRHNTNNGKMMMVHTHNS